MNVSVSKKLNPSSFPSRMLKGRSAVVTGSTSGIRLGLTKVVALETAKRGWTATPSVPAES